MPIRPSVPSDGDGDDDDRESDRDSIDAEPWSPDWDAEIEIPRTPTTEVRFHADRRFMWVKFVAAVIFVATPLVAGSSASGVVIGLVVGIGLAIYGLRDVLAPVRLAADAEGVTVVSGFAGQRRLTWDAIDRVRLDERSRYGGRQALLEIDAGDSLHFFSRYDLGMPPTEALNVVQEVRAARS